MLAAGGKALASAFSTLPLKCKNSSFRCLWTGSPRFHRFHPFFFGPFCGCCFLFFTAQTTHTHYTHTLHTNAASSCRQHADVFINCRGGHRECSVINTPPCRNPSSQQLLLPTCISSDGWLRARQRKWGSAVSTERGAYMYVHTWLVFIWRLTNSREVKIHLRVPLIFYFLVFCCCF